MCYLSTWNWGMVNQYESIYSKQRFQAINHQPVDFNGWGYDFLSCFFELCGRRFVCPLGNFTHYDFRDCSSSSANLYVSFGGFSTSSCPKIYNYQFCQICTLFYSSTFAFRAVLFLMARILYLFDEPLVGYIELLFRSHANSYFYKNHWERTSDRSHWL